MWIPCKITDYKKIDWNAVSGNDYDNSTWETQTNTAELVQIRKYGGFYVGRYEAGTSNITLSPSVNFAAQNTATDWVNDAFSVRTELKHTYTGSITSKAGEIPYYHADYFTALELSNHMYQTDNVQSGLVTGTMWDAIMKFIANGNDATVTTASTWGNYNEATSGVTFEQGKGRYATVDSDTGAMTSAFQVSNTSHHYGIRTTASTEGVKKKNLYDIAGNLWEWTQEIACVSTAEYYMLRGGGFEDTYSTLPACYRGRKPATNTSMNIGFRPALFIM